MVARSMKILLLIQAVAAYAIFHFLHIYYPTIPWWSAFCIALGSVILVRAAINSNNFIIAYRHGSATPEAYQLNLSAKIHLFIEEFCASMLSSSWYMPFKHNCDFIDGNSELPAVLLIHGYGCNSGYWAAFSKILSKQK